MARAVRVSLTLIVLAFVGIIAYAFGQFGAIRRVNTRTTGMLAATVYELAKRGDYQAMVSSGACHRDAVEALKRAAAESGKVERASVVRVGTGPFGVPVTVEMSVTRHGATHQEFLIRHTLGGFHQMSTDHRSPPW